MKRLLSAVLAVMLVLQLAPLAGLEEVKRVAAAGEAGADLYVSVDGDNAASGSFGEPLATLDEARDRIRLMKAGDGLPTGGVMVYVRGGEYQLEDTFSLSEEDSGTSGNPIVYAAYPGEEVRITGGVSLDGSAFVPVTDQAVLNRLPLEGQSHVLQLDLEAQGISDFGVYRRHGFLHDIAPAPLELFVNEQAMQLARWPNAGFLPLGQVLDSGSTPRTGDMTNRGGKFKYDYDRADRWTEANQLMLHGYFGVGYAEDNIPVRTIDTVNRTIELAEAHLYGLATAAAAWKTYYAYNLLEEIDQPGEYFMDYDSGILYVYPTTPLGNAHVQASMLEVPLVAIEDASFVTLDGFIFENSRGMGLYMEGGDSNRIVGNTFRNLGTVAISVGQGVPGPGYIVHEFTGQPESRIVGNIQGHIYQNQDWNRLGGVNHLIAGNEVKGTGAGGFYIGAGDRVTLEPGNVQVVNNQISDFGRRDKSNRPGIWLTGVGNKAINNEIYDSPHVAIYLNGNDHLVEKNEIHHVVQEADDMGAVYIGRNPSEQGNIIRYNFFHNLGSSHPSYAVYLDDGTSGTQVHGNVFYKAGFNDNIQIHGGHYNVISNNISIDIPQIVLANLWTKERWMSEMNGAFQRNRLLGAINIKQEPYASKYPILAGYYDNDNQAVELPINSNQLINNVAVNAGLLRSGSLTQSGNWTTNADPGFIDAANMNFGLLPDSEIYTQIPGFQPIPFESIGLYDDDFRTWTSHLGAFDALEPAPGEEDVHPGSVTFRWEASAGAVQYRLLVARDDQFVDIAADVTTHATNYVLEHELTYDETYYWKVVADSGSVSRPAEQGNDNGVQYFDSAKVDKLPDAPIVSFTRLDQVHLTWDRVDMATSYRIYRSSSQDGDYEWIGETGNALSFVDTETFVIQDYYYYVEAVNGLGAGAPSAIVAAYGGTAVYFEDLFENESQPDWVRESNANTGIWQLRETGNEQSLHFAGTFGNQKRALGREHYTIETRLRLNQWVGGNEASRMIFLIGNDSGLNTAGTRYQLMYRASGKLQLEKRAAGGTVQEVDFTLTPGQWYTFKLTVSPGMVRGYVNDQLLIQYEDANPLAPGSVGLQVWNGDVDIDEYRIHVPKWQSLSAPWELQEYGAGTQYAAYEQGEYTLRAVGADVWGTNDEFGYIAQTVSQADTSMITMEATLESLANVDNNAMAGIMFRSGEQQDAANFYLRMTPGGGVFTTIRLADGQPTTYKNVPPVAMPTKLKVTRENKLFTSYFMSAGSNEWVQLQQVTMNMPSEMLVGLAATSHETDVYTEAVFTDVSLTRSELERKAPIVGSVTPRNGAISLSWTGHDGITGYAVRYGSTSGSLDGRVDLPATASIHTLTGLTNGTPYYIRLVAKYGEIEKETEEFSAAPDASIVVRSAYEHIAAVSYDQMSGVNISEATNSIGSLDNGDWVMYNNIDFDRGVNRFEANVAVSAAQAGKFIDVYVDNPQGTPIGTLTVQSTGAFTIFERQSIELSSDIQGIHHVYLKFRGGFGVANLRDFTFDYPRDEEPTALLAGSETAVIGGTFEAVIGVGGLDDEHQVWSAVLQYDPDTVDFDRVQNDEGQWSLSPAAITELAPGWQLGGTAIKVEQGELRIILYSGSGAAVPEQMLKLNGLIKSSATTGATVLQLGENKVASSGDEITLVSEDVSWSIEVSAADKAALAAAIVEAEALHAGSFEGSEPGQYPTGSRATLEAAIVAAIAARNNSNLSQQEAASALAALEQAMSAFRSLIVPAPVVDKTALSQAITGANTLHNLSQDNGKLGQYEPGAKATLQTAIALADNVRLNGSSSQLEVSQAITALGNAVQAFKARKVTLVQGQQEVSIRDLSIAAAYFGVKDGESGWTVIQAADLFDEGEITIRALAAIAQMILDDWLKQ